MPLTPEVLIPRLGDVLVEQGLITNDQLTLALEKQKNDRLQGKSVLLGQVMREMGILDQQTLDQAITQQILSLQNSLKEANEFLEHRVQQRTAELEEAYKKLSELNELKSNFIANISHELRTPLTHILGYLDLMFADGLDNLHDEQKESLDIIRKASDRLGHLIEDLILFSSSEVGSISIGRETFDLVAVVKEVVWKSDTVIRKRKIQVKTVFPATPALVNADRSKIYWVINQLLDNAIKFNNEGGSIEVKVEEMEGKVRTSIIDTGIGIDKQKIRDIFEPFHQIDGSSTRKQGGTGLGLTLAKKILDAHNQVLNVTSTPAKGSTFSFCLDRPVNIE
jgi:two-component system, OmpR family, phosphate regulon sensor histidine kinase PhoR